MRISALVIALVLLATACRIETEVPEPAEDPGRRLSPEDAVVYIISPSDGAVISDGAVKVVFGLAGMGVAPAGVDFANSGHHHLLVDVAALPEMDQPIPVDSNHIHFGLGQTEAMLALSPGTHTLQLLLGDHRHIPHDPPIASAVVTVTVE